MLDAALNGQTEHDDAARFIARVVPWPAPGEPGYINLHWKNPKHPGMSGRPYNDLQTLLGFAKWATGRPDSISDIYFCLSQQAKTGDMLASGKVKAARHADDATFLKAVWADVDGYKDYPTKSAALDAIMKFVKDAALPQPTAIVDSGGGWHVYWISDKPLTPQEWILYANGLWELIQKHGLKADNVTTDAARILRVPGTFNHKTLPPRPVVLRWLQPNDIDFAAVMPKGAITPPVTRTNNSLVFDPRLFPKQKLVVPVDQYGNPVDDGTALAADCKRADVLIDPFRIIAECPHFAEAAKTGGRSHGQSLWMQTVLATTWFQKGRKFAHAFSHKHPTYDPVETDAMYDRKVADREDKGLGWQSCKTFENYGCKLCATCKHSGKIKSPLNLARPPQTPLAEPSFVDPYAEFTGPVFPLDVLSPTLAKFVDAEHRAMGADPSAIAMAALTTVAGAMHAQTLIRVGQGWWERPILWTALVGQPSTMKSPIIDKTKKPLSSVDHERDKRWRQEYAIWQQNNQK